ncbi:MAG: D-alanyl-D-alanine carboxypeptidase [Candidatus Omnitrophica bacterium]|nr:D-alanyl-D-alanine carboxypeptidase [Candidatus Omnitrophota bacterium]
MLKINFGISKILKGLLGSLILLTSGFPSEPVDAGAVSARSAIFSNSTRVVRYYGKNVHTKVPPASTTKVMTALLVLERLDLDDTVTVSSRATYPQPSKLHVRPGEKFKVRDLLYAVLMSSANDASVVLAEAVAGSEGKFVQMMNQRARQLGAKNTKFVNSHGLPSGKTHQYTTAYDMYLMFRAALQHDFFKLVIKKKYKTISSLDGRNFHLKSHNKILFKGWKQSLYGKTGYTRSAGQCFVGYLTKGDDICIIAVFGCTRRWDDIKHIVSRYGGIVL